MVPQWTWGLFPPVAMVNCASVSMCVHVFDEYLFSLWGVYLRIELLGHIIILCLSFLETSKLFSQRLQHFYFPH